PAYNRGIDPSTISGMPSAIVTDLKKYVYTDINGVARPQGGAFDLGAYEYGVTPASRCDLNGDGSVNAVDLQNLVNAILAASTSSAYDINKDSLVNILDAQVLTNVILGIRSCP